MTVVALGAIVPLALRAARELEREGIERRGRSTRARSSRSTRTRSPSRSRRRTASSIVHEAVQFCGFGAEIAAHIAEHCFWELDAPVVRVGAPSHPIPYQKDLELATLPGVPEIVAAVRSLTTS